jgi:2-polyprenyl-6-methoxyphenol hydroxylase-like FAD-dependent oxidoreductase
MSLAELRRQATDIRGGVFLNSAGKTVATLCADLIGFRDPGDLEVMRGDLAHILYGATRDDTEYLFDNSITTIEQRDDGVRVGFDRGESRTVDLVVGADGLHSNVRAMAFGPEARFAHHLGLSVAIYSVPNFLKLDRWEVAYSSAGHVANVYSVRRSADAKVLFFFPTPAQPYDRRDIGQQQRIVADALAGQGWEVPRLLAAMAAASDFYFDSLSQIRMEPWSAGRVVLLGDAGYCPFPASGQGTSLALVGAYVLAGELAAAGGEHHPAFARYESEMRGYVELNQTLGRDMVKQLAPATRRQAWLRTLTMRLMPYMPGKDAVMEKIIMKPIREAANGITLKAPVT